MRNYFFTALFILLNSSVKGFAVVIARHCVSLEEVALDSFLPLNWYSFALMSHSIFLF